MKRRVVILTEIISPYRIPLFNHLARHPEIDLHVIFLAETDPSLRQWRVDKRELKFSYEVLRSWRRRIWRYNVLVNFGLGRALNTTGPDVILCGGYSYLASWEALAWAQRHRVPFLLWSESNQQDLRRGFALVERLKDEFLRRCSGFLVPGQSARQYLRSLRIADDRIFTAPNAVDNERFAAAAEAAWKDAVTIRSQLKLPDRYILFVGRLVREKGVFELLSAYAKLDNRLREQFGLVFAGDGECRQELQVEAEGISPGCVSFTGFVEQEGLAICYALAEMLVLPTYSDTWGLVVNEAMACGLPVIVSRAAGCVSDLVLSGPGVEKCNGVVVESRDEAFLTAAIKQVAENPALCARMGANSQERISRFSPEAWSLGAAAAVEAAICVKVGRQ